MKSFEANIEPIWAEWALRENGASQSPEGLRALMLAATGDETAADLAAAQRALANERERSERIGG